MKTIDELIAEGVTGKRVFVRADLNVPLSGTTITDDGRIRAVQPTVEKLVAAGARVVVASHLGRPKGAPDPAFSLAPAAARLGELIGADVAFATDTVGESARATVAGLGDGQVAVLENLRFNPGETSKDDAERGAFADQLAELADLYVGDGFGAVHRKHASVFDLPARLPHAAGDLIATEVGVLKKLTENVERPYAVVLGGSKVSDKLGVIDHLLERADRILIGGGMAYTFLKAQGHEVGSSLLQEDQIPAVLEYLKRAEDKGVEFVLPVDVVVSETFPDLKAKAPTEHRTVPADAMPTASSAWTTAPRPTSCTHRSSPTRPPSSGTARWASSSTPTTPREPGPSPRPSSTPRASASSAVATPPRPSAPWASTRTHSDTSRPVAVPASNTSRARRFPASPHWRTDLS